MKNQKQLNCPVCSGKVYGRTDKRYCSIKCKNEHHRIARKRSKPLVFELNRKLLRNLNILEGLLGRKSNFLRVHKSILIRHGFDLNSITGVQILNNSIRLECYHYSFTIDADGIVYVRRMKKLNTDMPGFFERWEIDFPQGYTVKNNTMKTNFNNLSRFRRF